MVARAGESALLAGDLTGAIEAARGEDVPMCALSLLAAGRLREAHAAVEAAPGGGDILSVRARIEAALGRFARAKEDAQGALAVADGEPLWAGQALLALGACARVAGEMTEALGAYDDARARLDGNGKGSPLNRRVLAEVGLAAAEVLLDRDDPSDASDASARLSEVRDLVEEVSVVDLRLPLRLLLARARAAHGDEDGALAELERVVTEASESAVPDVLWRALAATSALQAARGAEFLARRHDLRATEVLESIATALPVKLRATFWDDPTRREVRRRASSESEHGARDGGIRPPDPTFHRPGAERRNERFLEILKRLASEHDVSRLLERITDSAIELSGAERGLVLLVNPVGQLEPALVRDAGLRPGDPSVAFSRSIAEAVLIDGEPIVTVDARDDRRLSEYMSVHKLMLRSVACLPIASRSGILGVLYLEHRMRRGRFGDDHGSELRAFADQAAIALENARLMEENAKRQVELEEANRQLAEAKAEIERVLVARTAELTEAQAELDRTRNELRGSYERHGILGRSEPMRRVFAVIDRVRDTDVPVVIQGESGTGKELAARAIHYGGPRKKGPFVAVNCAAIPEALLESELFGHVRGAFTGADRDRRGVLTRASGGTLFLDEVGDMPAKMQVDLLRVLQDGKVTPVGSPDVQEVDVRVISASNKPLKELVARGDFREDLFYRLNVVEIRLPALRERLDDIPLLAEHFLARIAKREGVRPRSLTREALGRLAAHPLPGNVRQLEHMLLNACVMTEGDVIRPDDLSLDAVAQNERVSLPSPPAPRPGLPPPQSLDDYKAGEKQRILKALEDNGWNRVRAASQLGMARRTFYRRLREHGILE